MGDRGRLSNHHTAILAATQSSGYYGQVDPSRGTQPTSVGGLQSHSVQHNQSNNNSSNVNNMSNNQPQEVAPDRPIGYGAFGVVW